MSSLHAHRDLRFADSRCLADSGASDAAPPLPSLSLRRLHIVMVRISARAALGHSAPPSATGLIGVPSSVLGSAVAIAANLMPSAARGASPAVSALGSAEEGARPSGVVASGVVSARPVPVEGSVPVPNSVVGVWLGSCFAIAANLMPSAARGASPAVSALGSAEDGARPSGGVASGVVSAQPVPVEGSVPVPNFKLSGRPRLVPVGTATGLPAPAVLPSAVDRLVDLTVEGSHDRARAIAARASLHNLMVWLESEHPAWYRSLSLG